MATKTGDELRKLASVLRENAEADKEVQIKQAAHVLRAAKGLTILRDKVRGA